MKLNIYSRDSRYSIFGRLHFLMTYGTPVENGDSLPFVQFMPETTDESDVRFRGWLEGLKVPVPLFSVPREVDQHGEVLLKFSAPSNSFCCASRDASGITIGFDIFHEIGLMLSGILDHHSALPENFTYLYPYVDLLEKFFFESLKEVHFSKGLPVIHKAFWPEGRPFALCLTHDVDELKKTYQWITFPVKKILRMDGSGIVSQLYSLLNALHGKEPFWTFPEIIALEEQYQARSSFYFLHETAEVKFHKFNTWRHLGRRYSYDAPNTAQLLRLLREGGWEIGLHGSFDSFTDLKKLREEKEKLEKVLGAQVTGIRQHNLNLKIPDTWSLHETLGLSYDTTLGFNDRVGFRWGTSFPFNPFLPEQFRSINILEIPLIIEDLPFFEESDPFSLFINIVDEIRYVNGLLTVLWHPPVFNNQEFPGWKDAYEQILAYAFQNRAWIAPAKDIAAWWKERREISFSWRRSDGEITIYSSVQDRRGEIVFYLPPGLQIKELHNSRIMRKDPESGGITLQIDPGRSGDCTRIYIEEVVP